MDSASRTSSQGLNAGNSITFWQILLINRLLLTSHYGNNSHCSHMFSVRDGAFLSLNYRDQEWQERSWAIVLIFLCTPLTLINYGTSAVKRQNINKRKEKQDIFPSNYAKCAWCPHKQTNEQTNMNNWMTNTQTVAVQNGSDRYMCLLFLAVLHLETWHCYILLVINNQLWG